MVGLGLILVVPVFVRLLADLTLRVTSQPTLTIAARRLQAQPAGVTRVVGGLLIGLFLVVGARSVVVAFESTPQYLEAAAQLNQRTMATFQSGPGDAADTVRKIQAVQGVRRVEDFPRLVSDCGPRSRFCVNVVVASCAQLTRIAPGLQGCRDGVAIALTNTFAGRVPAALPPLWAANETGSPEKVGGVAPVRVRVQRASPHSGIETAWGGYPLGSLNADAIIPPSTPGVAALTARTQQALVATGDPGRDAAQRLQALPLQLQSVPDFSDYDFVAELRALVWAVAAVIMSVGLLAFAVAAADRAVTRRREVTALQLVGVPRSVLRRTQWVESAAPLALGSFLAIGFGVLAGATYLDLNNGENLPVPWTQSLVLTVAAGLGSALVGVLTVIASSPRISPDLIRQE